MNCSKVMKGRVFSSKSLTKGLAGLSPITLSKPNQKKITKIENLAKGILTRLKKLITKESILCNMFRITIIF